jgi:large subunit ribosomal protein L10
MMDKAKKQNYISEMTTQFDKSEAVIVTHYKGLTVSQLDELRAKMREHGIIFKVTKNRITKLALEKTRCKELSDLFTGPTAVALSQDAITSAKILTNFSKENSNLKILGGIMGNDILDVAGVKNVATLPSLDEARAKIVGILRSPAQKIASILLAPASKIAILALEKSKK